MQTRLLRGQRKIVGIRYDSEEEEAQEETPRVPAPSISFTTTDGGTNSSISSSLSGSCERSPSKRKQILNSPPIRRIRGTSSEYVVAAPRTSAFATTPTVPTFSTAAAIVKKSSNGNNSDTSGKSAAKNSITSSSSSSTNPKETLRHSTTTKTTTTTTVITTTLCLEPTSSSSFSSGCLLTPSDVGTTTAAAKSSRGQQHLVARPGRYVNARDDDDDSEEEQEEEYKKTLPKRKTTRKATSRPDNNNDNDSRCSSNNSSVFSNSNHNRHKWRVVDVNKRNPNVSYSSTAEIPAPRVLYDAPYYSSKQESYTNTTTATSAKQVLNQERVRAAELRTARMKALMQENMIRPNLRPNTSFRGFSSRIDDHASAEAAKRSTAAPVKPCRVKSSDAGKQPLRPSCPVKNNSKNNSKKPCRFASSSSNKAATVNRHPSNKNNSMTRRASMSEEEEASDIDSLMSDEEYVTEEEDIVSDEDEYTEVEVVSDDEEEEEKDQKQEASQRSRSVSGRWGEQEQQQQQQRAAVWKSGTQRTRGSEPSVDVTENTTQYDSDDEQVEVAVVKEQKYEPYFAPLDDLTRSRQTSRRAKDPIKLSPGAMSLKDRLAMFQGK